MLLSPVYRWADRPRSRWPTYTHPAGKLQTQGSNPGCKPQTQCSQLLCAMVCGRHGEGSDLSPFFPLHKPCSPFWIPGLTRWSLQVHWGPEMISCYSSHPICCCCLVAKSCLTLCHPMDRSPPGSSVHGISQARYWCGLPFPSPGDLPNLEIESASPAFGRWVLYYSATREALTSD